MAEFSRITDYDNKAIPEDDDVIYIVDESGVTPADIDRNATVGQLKSKIVTDELSGVEGNLPAYKAGGVGVEDSGEKLPSTFGLGTLSDSVLAEVTNADTLFTSGHSYRLTAAGTGNPFGVDCVLVVYHNGASEVVQVAINPAAALSTANRIQTRSYSGSWTAWERFVMGTEIDNKLDQGVRLADAPSWQGVKVPDARLSFPLPHNIITPTENTFSGLSSIGKPLSSASYAQCFAVSRTHFGIWGGDANILGIYEYLGTTPTEIVLTDYGGTQNNAAFCSIRLYSIGATATVTGWIAHYSGGSLTTRTFNGSALGTVGNTLSGLDSTQYAAITPISPSVLGVVIAHGNGSLQAYIFDGTDWTTQGDPYSLTGSQGTFKVRFLKETSTEQYYLCTYVSTTRKLAVVARNKSTYAWRTVFEEDAPINTTTDVGIAVHNPNLFVWISDASPYRSYWYKVTDSGTTLIETLGARAATAGSWIRPELVFLGDTLVSVDPGPKIAYLHDFDFFTYRARHTDAY